MKPQRPFASFFPRSTALRRSLTIFILLALVVSISAIPALMSYADASTSREMRVQASPTTPSPGKVQASALRQIEALIAEKQARTPTQRKIDSNLLYASRQSRGQTAAMGAPTLRTSIQADTTGKTIVDISADVTDAFLAQLKQDGVEVLSAFPQYHTLRARVALGQLETIAAHPAVRFIQPKQEAAHGSVQSATSVQTAAPRQAATTRAPFAQRADAVRAQLASALPILATRGTAVQPNKVNTSEGDKTHRADVARATLGVSGAGIKIGVLSDGVDSLATAQATGDLPANVIVLPGQDRDHDSTADADEGTAMLEIVHDLAPNAQLYFATGFTGIVEFAENIRALRAAGCDIIVDDISYFAESPFQLGQTPAVISPHNGGVVSQAVADVTAAGALYFSSAGNSGNLNDNTSGVWEGDFVPSALKLTGDPRGAALFSDFDPGPAVEPLNPILSTGGPIGLHWSDPLGKSSNDYDLYIIDPSGSFVVAASTNIQDGHQDPIELLGSSTYGRNYQVGIVKFATAAVRYLHVNTNRGTLYFGTAGQTSGHASIPAAVGVAASPAAAGFRTGAPVGPYPNPFGPANVVETFSSDGPRQFFFNADGTPITPGKFVAGGGRVVQKPDITAADGVSTSAPGFNPFFGTSAAAPHAAAIAALVKSVDPKRLTNTQVRQILTSTAIDIEATGIDRDSGVGIIDAVKAVSAAKSVRPSPTPVIPTPVVPTPVPGNQRHTYLPLLPNR